VRDPVRQRLDMSFNSVADDRSAAASDGRSPLIEPRRKLGELQRDLELRRSAEKGASTSRAASEQLHVQGSGIRRDAQHSHQHQRQHLGGAALHGSLDLGRTEWRTHARNSEVSVSALLGRASSLQQLSPEQRERLRPAAAVVGESPTKAVLERHTQRRGRGSPRRASRLQWGNPPASPDAATARRAKSLSPSKKPALARLDVENLEVFPEGPDSRGNTPSRAALGDVTPSHNRKVRLPSFHISMASPEDLHVCSIERACSMARHKSQCQECSNTQDAMLVVMLQMMGSPTHGRNFEAGLTMKERIDRDAVIAQQDEEIKRWEHYVWKKCYACFYIESMKSSQNMSQHCILP